MVIAAMLAVACSTGASEEQTPAQPAPVQIGAENVVRVARGELVVGPVISGELRAGREATVRAELSGPMIDVAIEEGQSVRRGALLGRIEARQLEDGRRSAETAVKSAENQFEVAQREASRTEQLVKAGALAARDLDRARASVITAEAQAAEARARLVSAQSQLADTVLNAPIAGIVSDRAVNVGDVVSPGTALFTIIDPSSMRLEASVPSDEPSATLRIGARVQFTIRGIRPGVRRTDRTDQPARPIPPPRQVPIFVSIPNAAGRLVAGLFAEGRVVTQSAEGIDRAGERGQHVRINPRGCCASTTARPSGSTVALGLRDRAPSECRWRRASSRATCCCAARRRASRRGRRCRWAARRRRRLAPPGDKGSHVHLRCRDSAPRHHRRDDARLVVFGVVALRQLDTDEFPDVQPPIVAIAIPYPGASPDTVEREVVDPIEEVDLRDQRRRRRSTRRRSTASAPSIVEFVFEKDLQQATQEIRDEISGIRNELPPEMEEPILTRFDPADMPIVSLTLSSPTLTGPELTRIADPDITRRLRGDLRASPR